MEAPDRDELLEWLRHRPLLAEHPELPIMMVHAGLSPAWDAHTARSCAREVETLLRGDQYSWLLHNMYGDQPDTWDENLLGIERYRYIINTFTRMRFCYFDGRLDFKCKKGPTESTPGLRPWFEQREHHVDDPILVFGHWAALMGATGKADIKGLDTGCVWGNSLTLWRYEDDALIATPCPAYAK